MGQRAKRARRVMVVEDDAGIREVLVELLSLEGFDPVAARNGQEALARLRRDRVHPEFILLDLMMPVMDGWEFRAEQLRDPELAGIPVVVMTASDPQGVAADALVAKPFGADALLGAIARVTGRPTQGDGRSGWPSGTCCSATEFMQ